MIGKHFLRIKWNAWPVRLVRIHHAKNEVERPWRLRITVRPEHYPGFARRVVRSRVLAPCSRHIALFVIAAAFFTGCAVGPNYSPPLINDAFAESNTSQGFTWANPHCKASFETEGVRFENTSNDALCMVRYPSRD